MPTKPRPRAPKVSPLAYEDRLDARPLSQVDLVVIHCTELPDLATAREYGERVLHTGSGTGNSGHYYVDRHGDCHRFVAPDRVAHHVRGYNPRSIGIDRTSVVSGKSVSVRVDPGGRRSNKKNTTKTQP